MILRLSRLDGRVGGRISNSLAALRSAATLSRISLLASVSRYSFCASEAGPRTLLSPRTTTSKSPPSFVIRSVSPTRTSRAALATCAFDRIRPKSQLFFASVRVLKKRAAHSQASILIPLMASSPQHNNGCESIHHRTDDGTHPDDSKGLKTVATFIREILPMLNFSLCRLTNNYLTSKSIAATLASSRDP